MTFDRDIAPLIDHICAQTALPREAVEQAARLGLLFAAARGDPDFARCATADEIESMAHAHPACRTEEEGTARWADAMMNALADGTREMPGVGADVAAAYFAAVHGAIDVSSGINLIDHVVAHWLVSRRRKMN